jgi:hypothetical protein
MGVLDFGQIRTVGSNCFHKRIGERATCGMAIRVFATIVTILISKTEVRSLRVGPEEL